MPSRLAILVVTYNSAGVIRRCVESCRRYAPQAELLVIDNGSADDTRDIVNGLTGVKLIHNPGNPGFAAAVNRGVSATAAEQILLLNPDAELAGGLEHLQAAAVPGVGVTGGRLLGSDGEPQHGFDVRGFPGPFTLSFEILGWNRLFPANPVNRRYRRPAKAGEVDQPAGAFLLFTREAFETVGGFDVRFAPVWFEDVDFCYRVKRAGYRILHIPEARARHIGGHSVTQLGWSRRQEYWYGSLLKYAGKHFSRPSRAVVSLSIFVAALPRALVAALATRSTEPFRIFGRVCRNTVGCWRDPREPSGKLPGKNAPEMSCRH